MTDAADLSTVAPAGFKLGDPISLSDLLSLPPDGRRYARDEQGRLTLMAPDKPSSHRRPLGRVARFLTRSLEDPWEVTPRWAPG